MQAEKEAGGAAAEAEAGAAADRGAKEGCEANPWAGREFKLVRHFAR